MLGSDVQHRENNKHDENYPILPHQQLHRCQPHHRRASDRVAWPAKTEKKNAGRGFRTEKAYVAAGPFVGPRKESRGGRGGGQRGQGSEVVPSWMILRISGAAAWKGSPAVPLQLLPGKMIVKIAEERASNRRRRRKTPSFPANLSASSALGTYRPVDIAHQRACACYSLELVLPLPPLPLPFLFRVMSSWSGHVATLRGSTTCCVCSAPFCRCFFSWPCDQPCTHVLRGHSLTIQVSQMLCHREINATIVPEGFFSPSTFKTQKDTPNRRPPA